MSDAELLILALDGALDAGQRRALHERLQTDAPLREELRAQVHAEHLLQQLHADDDGFSEAVLSARRAQGGSTEAFVAKVVRGRDRRRPARAWPLWLAVPLAAGLVLAIWLLQDLPAAQSDWRMPAVGGVLVQRDGGWRDPAPDEGLRVGDRLRVIDDEGLRLEQVDGSVAQIAERAQVGITASGLVLHEGELEASVAKRCSDRPFIVQAREAAVRVLGTRYHLEVDDDAAELAVDEGSVMVRHRKGGQRRVATGEILRWTTHGGVIHYAVRDSDELFAHDWGSALPRSDSVGIIDDVGGFCRPGSHFDAPSGHRLGRFSSGSFWRHPLGSYHPDDRLHIEARFAARGWVVVIVGMRRSDDSVYNIIHTIPGVPANEGWQTLTVPLRRFRSTETQPIGVGDDYIFYLLLPLESCGMELRSARLARSLAEPVAGDWE